MVFSGGRTPEASGQTVPGPGSRLRSLVLRGQRSPADARRSVAVGVSRWQSVRRGSEQRTTGQLSLVGPRGGGRDRDSPARNAGRFRLSAFIRDNLLLHSVVRKSSASELLRWQKVDQKHGVTALEAPAALLRRFLGPLASLAVQYLVLDSTAEKRAELVVPGRFDHPLDVGEFQPAAERPVGVGDVDALRVEPLFDCGDVLAAGLHVVAPGGVGYPDSGLETHRRVAEFGESYRGRGVVQHVGVVLGLLDDN